MKPVTRRWCSYEALVDGRLTLYDVAEMNEAIDVLDENNARINKKPD